MRLIKVGLLLTVLLAISSISVFAQSDKDPVNWDVTCVDGIKNGEVIPCENFQSNGGSFSITRDFLINWGLAGTSVTLTFTQTDDARDRSLKVIEVLPASDEDEVNWEYKFMGGLQGPGGVESKAYFVRLGFYCKNAQNSKNGRGGYCADGPYNGSLKVKDTKSGAVFTVNLTVNVRSLPKD